MQIALGACSSRYCPHAVAENTSSANFLHHLFHEERRAFGLPKMSCFSAVEARLASASPPESLPSRREQFFRLGFPQGG